MKTDKIPQVIIVPGIKYSIFSGVKYCFVNVDPLFDWSWDGEKEMIDFLNKAESVLFNKKELEAFCPSKSVHSFLLELNEGRKEEIARLKKEMRTAKTFWVHSRYKNVVKNPNLLTTQSRELIMENWTCNPKQQIKDRIEFLENNVVRFVEIHFQ